MKFDFSRLFSKSKILVIGDVMLDHYVLGSVSRISPEAPVPVLVRESESHYLGGAGNVFSNIHSLGGNGDIISVIGDDFNGEYIEKMIFDKSTLSVLVKDKTRKTTIKSRYIGNSHQLLRVDDEDCLDINQEIQLHFMERLNAIIDFYDCVIMEDYNKGLLTPEIIKNVVNLCRSKGKKLIVDPKIRNVDFYRGCSVLKPNFSEFCILANKKMNVSDFDLIIEEARKIIKKMDLESILVTLSDSGILYVSKYESYHSPGYPIKVSDVSGAGDTVTAMFSLCWSSGVDLKETLDLCNVAGSIACSFVGAVSVNIEDVINSEHLKNL